MKIKITVKNMLMILFARWSLCLNILVFHVHTQITDDTQCNTIFFYVQLTLYHTTLSNAYLFAATKYVCVNMTFS